MLILSDEQVDELINIDTCIERLERSYLELGNGWAGNTRRTELVAANPDSDNQEPCYGLKSMMGVVSGLNIGALRLNSDKITWPATEVGMKRVKVPKAPGKRYVALVLLFDMETGELLSMFPDASIQRMRVGCTSALGARYLSRTDSEIVGVYGSGWQAGSHLMAICRVRPVKKAMAFSPNWESCKAFCDKMNDMLDVAVVPVKRPEEITDAADIVMSCTNSLEHVVLGKRLRPGMHVSMVKSGELDQEAYERADLLVLNSRQLGPDDLLVNGRQKPPPGLQKERDSYIYGFRFQTINWHDLPLLSDVILGKAPTRQSESQISCFANNMGLGTQFAAVGHAVYQEAKKRNVGQEMPSEWFSQLNHP
jgi:ornithine cyclodeaminase/alanine dehydrogenase-like protein (mu-crystallin family)